MWKWIKTRVKNVPLRYIAVALALPAAWLLWKYAVDTPKPTGQQGPVVVAQVPEKVVEKVKTIVVPGPERIVFLEKASLSTTLKMPELNAVAGNPTAAVEIQPHAGKTTAVSVLDNAGRTTILTRQEPVPFFQVKRDIRASARYLFVGANIIESDLVAAPLRIGPVEVEAGVGVEVRRNDSALGARGYIGASYRF